MLINNTAILSAINPREKNTTDLVRLVELIQNCKYPDAAARFALEVVYSFLEQYKSFHPIEEDDGKQD